MELNKKILLKYESQCIEKILTSFKELIKTIYILSIGTAKFMV